MVYELSLKNVIKNRPGIKLGNAKGTILHSPSLGRNHLVSCQLGWIWAAAHRLAASPNARRLPVLSLGICFHQGGQDQQVYATQTGWLEASAKQHADQAA